MTDVREMAFRDPSWLRSHVGEILESYHPDCLDTERGGYCHRFDVRDGKPTERDTKLLVETSRFVVTFGVGALLDEDERWRDAAAHGLEFLREYHWDDEHGGYTWALDGREISDGRKDCYGHAFALLATAIASRADVPGAEHELERAARVLDERFWEDDPGTCRSLYDRDWSNPLAYRGQNENMHVCEAYIAAFEATGDDRYLDRALAVAELIARDLPERADGLVWEHNSEDWTHDWSPGETPSFAGPAAYMTGHQIEWAKLLALLEHHSDGAEPWLLERARELFDRATEIAWDDDHGGFYYAFDREGEIVGERKAYWVAAEAIAATALLADVTGEGRFWSWYDRVWEYAYEHHITPLGLWHASLTAENELPAGYSGTDPGKTDYHPVAACYEAIRVLEDG